MEDKLEKNKDLEKTPKKKMSSGKKATIIYSVELIAISLVFFTVALLEVLHVIPISERHHIIFNFISLAGGSWLIADFVWASFSSKRKKRISYLDKILHLPLGLYLISFDVIMFVHWNVLAYEVYLYGMTGAFFYISACYMFEGIYHFFIPIPGLIEDDEPKEEIKEEKSDEIVDVKVEDVKPIKSKIKTKKEPKK